MEKSENSFTKKTVDESESASFEFESESGWTAYFEDYSSHQPTSSLLSDAASHPPHHHSLKLNFHQKQTHFSIDSSLEDTATSPHNSPKVADLGLFDANNYQRKTNDYISSSLGKGGAMEENCEGEDGRNLDMSYKSKAGGYTDLKKRGLCLVPLSMFANFMA